MRIAHSDKNSTKMFTKKGLNSLALIALVVTALVISGCSGQKKDALSIPETYVGVLGVDASFAPESVPNLVSSGSSSNVVLLITNKGAEPADLSSIIVTVRDTKGMFRFDKPVINGGEIKDLLGEGSESKTTGKLAGKSSNTVGSLDSITLKPSVIGEAKDAVSTGILATICYAYNTLLTANVCVDASSYTFQKIRKPCDPKLALSFASQGAPVAVKKIETITERSGNSVTPKFKIYVGNVGNGLIIDKDSLDLFCTDKPTDSKDKINRVWIDSVYLGDSTNEDNKLSCSNVGKDGKQLPIVVSKDPTKNFVLCTYTKGFSEDSGTFATPLRIKLSYGYTATSNPVPVTVEKSLNS